MIEKENEELGTAIIFGGDELKLFTLADGVPTINPALRALTVFKELIIRDKGSKGDADGRKKNIANKEIQFIYFKYYPNSPYLENSSKNTLDEDIKRGIQLPDEWVEDSAVKAAAEYFIKTLTITATRKVLETARDALFLTSDMISRYQQSVSKVVNKEFSLESPEEYEAEAERAKLLMGLVGNLLKISKDLPDAVDNLEKSRAKVMRETETSKYSKKVIDSDQIPD